jgi:hypothetical protein
VKYNPDKRDFMLTEGALNSFNQQQKPNPKDNLNYYGDFDTVSDVSKTES